MLHDAMVRSGSMAADVFANIRRAARASATLLKCLPRAARAAGHATEH